MEFSGKELSALVKMGVAMAAADGKLADEEKAAIVLGMAEFGLDEEAVKAHLALAKSMTPVQALSILTAMDISQQKFATGFLATVMVSDGDIDDSEVKLWQLVCTLCGFPTMTIAEAVEFWRTH